MSKQYPVTPDLENFYKKRELQEAAKQEEIISKVDLWAELNKVHIDIWKQSREFNLSAEDHEKLDTLVEKELIVHTKSNSELRRFEIDQRYAAEIEKLETNISESEDVSSCTSSECRRLQEMLDEINEDEHPEYKFVSRFLS